MQKNVYYTLGLAIGLIVTIVSHLARLTPRLVACDVGQGDGILLIKGSNQVLIDGGPSGDKILACLGRQLPFWDRHIELIVMTNSDYDHMNGLSTVLERYSVTTFVTSDGVHPDDALSHLIAALRGNGARVVGVAQGESIRVGSRTPITLSVLWPPHADQQYVAVLRDQMSDAKRSQILSESAKRGDLNERSVVLEWDEYGYKTLLTGDSGFQTERELAAEGRLVDIDLLKVGHHGSKYATSTDLLDRTIPEQAVISVGAKNRYGHPTQETLDRLAAAHVSIQRTDEKGDITYPMPIQPPNR